MPSQPHITDRRGAHFREKAAAGLPLPKVAGFVKVWSDRARQLEKELRARLPDYIPPWRRSVGAMLGNTTRAQFTHLLLQHLKGNIELEFAPGTGELGEKCNTLSDGTHFMGLRAIHFVRHDEYNRESRDILPSPVWAIRNISNGPRKTVQKHWRALGMQRTLDVNKCQFEPDLYAEHCNDRDRANEKRMMKHRQREDEEDARKKAEEEAQRAAARPNPSKIPAIEALLNWD